MMVRGHPPPALRAAPKSCLGTSRARESTPPDIVRPLLPYFRELLNARPSLVRESSSTTTSRPASVCISLARWRAFLARCVHWCPGRSRRRALRPGHCVEIGDFLQSLSGQSVTPPVRHPDVDAWYRMRCSGEGWSCRPWVVRRSVHVFRIRSGRRGPLRAAGWGASGYSSDIRG